MTINTLMPCCATQLLCFLLLWLSCNLAPCTYTDFKYLITPCIDNKRQVLFSYINDCDRNDEASKPIPTSMLLSDCFKCDKGYKLVYSFELNKLSCSICPANYHSYGGSFIIRGEQSEWTEDRLRLFRNKCYSFNSNGKPETNCKAFTSSGYYLTANNVYNSDEYQYYAQLAFKVTLATRGELRFQYQKATLIEKGFISGIFRLIINYKSVYDDYTSQGEWTDYRYPLAEGTYSIMFAYMKYVVSEPTKRLSFKLKTIEIEGVETAALQCLLCIGGTSAPGSTYCLYCSEGQYFNDLTKQCVQCPTGTESRYNSIGIDSCQQRPNCTDSSFQKIVSPLCNKHTNQQKVHYELIQDNCNEDPKPKPNTMQCEECPIGNHWSTIEGEGDMDHLRCLPCKNGTFTSKPNQSSCSQCEGVLAKVFYIHPDDYSKNKMEFKVDIDDFDGEMTIAFECIDKSKEMKVDIVIDGLLAKSFQSSDKNEKIEIAVGNHEVVINSVNAIISSVAITNTRTGGGYRCSPCSNGFLIKQNDQLICQNCGAGFELNEAGQCQACSDGYHKQSNDHFDKCAKCPLFTQSNELKTGCKPFDVLTNSKFKVKVHMAKYQLTRDYLCLITNNLCTESFYGPMRDLEKNLYFISFNQANLFSNEAFTYKFNELKTKAFVYKLTNDNSALPSVGNESKPKGEGLMNSKFVVNLGKDIAYVKLLYGHSNKGVVINYANGDICKEMPGKRYQSIMLFSCPRKIASEDSGEDGMSELHSPKFIKKQECTYYFEWPSRNACPICLSSQVSKMTMPCKGFSRSVYYSETDNCIISNTTGLKESSNEEMDERSSMITNENDADILSAYRILDTFNDLRDKSNNDTESEEAVYIESTRISEPCYLYDDFDKEILIIIIAIPIVYLIIALIFAFICCKYCKIRNDYHRLVEDPVSTENLNNSNFQSNRINQQIELGSIASKDQHQ